MLLLKLEKCVEMDVLSFCKSNSILLSPRMSTFQLFKRTELLVPLSKVEKLQELLCLAIQSTSHRIRNEKGLFDLEITHLFIL
jgi:hypothetical protein